MSKLKRLQYGYFLIKGINLKEVMIENRFYRRYIDHLRRLSKNHSPFLLTSNQNRYEEN